MREAGKRPYSPRPRGIPDCGPRVTRIGSRPTRPDPLHLRVKAAEGDGIGAAEHLAPAKELRGTYHLTWRGRAAGLAKHELARVLALNLRFELS